MVRYLELKSNKNIYFLKPGVCPRNLCCQVSEIHSFTQQILAEYYLGARGTLEKWEAWALHPRDAETGQHHPFPLAFAKFSTTSHTPPPRACS